MVKRAQALLWLNEGEKITVIPATGETTDGIQPARLACHHGQSEEEGVITVC